jgi:hypothetical protein
MVRDASLARSDAMPPAPLQILITADALRQDDAALAVFRAGHLPVMLDALVRPLITAAGSCNAGDAACGAVFEALAERLAGRCDGYLRVGAPTMLTDALERLFDARSKPIYRHLDAVPRIDQRPGRPMGQPMALTELLFNLGVVVHPGLD